MENSDLIEIRHLNYFVAAAEHSSFRKAGPALGISESAIGRHVPDLEDRAFLGMFLVTVPLILLSGFATPVDNMPGWLQVVAFANPCRHFLVIVEGVFLKDMPTAVILSNTWPLAIIASVSLTASALLFRARVE